MQVIESEIVIPLKYKSNLKGSLIVLCVMLVYFVGLSLFLIIMASQAAAKAKVTFANDPVMAEDIAHQWITQEIWGIIMLVLMLFLYCIVFTFMIRKLRAPSPYVRISHEGVFTSRDSLLIKWAEIKELSLAIFMGSPYLRIVPWNVEEVAARAKASSRPLIRFGINITLMFFRHAKSRAPIGLSQRALPISINELLTAIEEQFGAELREHHILVGNGRSE